MTNSTNKPTVVFWIISVIALIWNLLGVVQYLTQAYMTDEVKAALPEADQAYFANLPAWVTAAFAIAVFAGALGCIGLLLRKKWATSLFMLSLITVVAQLIYNFFMQDAVEVVGIKMVMQLLILAVALFLVWFSKKSTTDGYLS